MANFSTDQVRQLYTVLTKGTSPLANTAAAGTVAIKYNEEDVWFEYVTPNGNFGNNGVVRSDLINKKNVELVVATPPKSRPLKRQVVSLDPNINGGAPVVGQEYILRYTFYNIGMGGPENQYIKNGGAYRVKTGDTAATLMAALKALSDKNFSREAYPYVTTTVSGNTLVIEEYPQPWVLGKKQAGMVDFQVQTVPIVTDGGYYPWGVVTDTTATNDNVVTNGKTTADMEWFYYGERGDYFRQAGWPDNFDAKYLVDPSKEYNFVDIQYFYAGDTEDVQKSKKYITLAIPTDSTYTVATVITDLEAAGLTVVDKTPATP